MTGAALPMRTSPALASAAIAHGFLGRQGGASQGLYASLNAGPGSRDAADAVTENRARIAAAFGVAPERLLSVYQIHSARAVHVRGPWSGARPEADAMVAGERGLALCILAADCAPVLFADPQARVIGAAHAGWKGALGGVLEATIAAMEEAGASRGRLRAAVGPCIGKASYEVGPEYEARFLAADAANARFFSAGAGDRRQFDLSAYCIDRLTAAGVAHTERLAADTCALADEYFSNRRALLRGESDFGRNASVIALV